MKKEIRALCIGAWDRKEKEGSAMSEEFKKEEINGEAAEKTKAAEHTEEVKAETTAEQSAAETEKPQETAD